MNFFKVSSDKQDPHEALRLAEWVDGEIEIEHLFCTANSGHQRGGKRLTDLSVVLPRGPLNDFVWTWYSDCLVQNHVVEIFRRASLTGFDVKPVRARFRTTSNKPPTFWEIVTTGQRVRAAAAAGLYVKIRCEACDLIQYSAYENGLPVDESSWDGSDFFRFEEWGGLFVTERARDCILHERLTGMSFIQVESLRWPEGVSKP